MDTASEVISDVPGDFIEFGVDIGSTTFPLSKMLEERAPEKRIYACDIFAGFPYDDPYPDGWKKGEWDRCKLDQFLTKAILLQAERHLVVVPGAFEESLPKLSSLRFSFAWVDADLGPSTDVAAKYLLPRMNQGGIAGFHDYRKPRHPGVEHVVDNFVRTWPGIEEIFFQSFTVFFKFRFEQ